MRKLLSTITVFNRQPVLDYLSNIFTDKFDRYDIHNNISDRSERIYFRLTSHQSITCVIQDDTITVQLRQHYIDKTPIWESSFSTDTDFTTILDVVKDVYTKNTK